MVPKLKRTLYIGLGGTGFKTLLRTKRAFVETYGEVPPMIKFLCIDSDQNQYNNTTLPSIYGDIKIQPNESSDIIVDGAGDKVSRNRQDLTWLPDPNLFAVKDLTNGCGMVRTNGRIAFSFNYGKCRANIQNALNEIRNLNAVHNDKYELISNDVEASIVFSIAGGTGSGSFLDIAYLVKDIMKTLALPETSKIIGYMVLPDVYDAQLTFGKARLLPNAYGSLMDLDYLSHFTYDKEYRVNYLTESRVLRGEPFNSVIAISNSNHNGDVVSESDSLSEMISLAMVVSAGELSSGVQSVANNLERDVNSGDYDIENKRAIMGTLGMSEITFRAKELSRLYSEKAARETATALLNPGSNMDNAANAWINTNNIRENMGQDQVIDFLLSKMPQSSLPGIYDKANPKKDVDDYLTSKNVAVDPNALNQKVLDLKQRIKQSFKEEIRTIVNSRGPACAEDFISQVKKQVELCLGEMRDELKRFEDAKSARNSATKTAIEEYKSATQKFFGKQKAVQEAEENLCIVATNEAVNSREIYRRQGAISFYTWFEQEMAQMTAKLENIISVIRSACQIARDNIATLGRDLAAPRGLFVVDLTEPYISQVDVTQEDINLNQFMLSLPKGVEVFNFDEHTPDEVVGYIHKYCLGLKSGAKWATMSVEDALMSLPKEEARKNISKAIALSSPMCPLNFHGYLNKQLNNYYYVGVQEQSTTGLRGEIINFDEYIPSGEMHETYFASTGSRDRIVIYHQYGVFPTFAISGAESYRLAHDNYMQRPTSYSCFFDEDLRKTMVKDGVSLSPAEKTDDSLEMWVKGLIFGLIARDENGTFQYKDETNEDQALFGYWTSLGTTYRDEAFSAFKRESVRLQPQYEKYMDAQRKAKGQAAIDAILADAKSDYLDRFSLNDIPLTELRKNTLYKDILKQLTDEVNYVNKEL